MSDFDPQKLKLTNILQSRGAIRVADAYAQGKMLNNSNWKLPRLITPSDIDLVFDDSVHGRMLFCELSSSATEWQQVSVGQRRLHENLMRLGKNAVMSALLKHSVPWTHQIDTVKDITSFQLMWCKDNTIWHSIVYDGKWLESFVSRWYEGLTFEIQVKI